MSNEPETSRYLGIDYGKAKVGLAIADSETRIAFVYGTLENNKGLFQKLAEIIKKEDVTKVIIGVPSYVHPHTNGVSSIKKQKNNFSIGVGVNAEDVEYLSEDFGHTLKNLVPNIEVEFTNEMFTTKMAEANLIEKGIKGIKNHDDEEAARIILQSWLDQTMKHGT